MLDESTLQGMARIANKGEPISMEDVGRMVQVVEWLRICGYEVRLISSPSPDAHSADYDLGPAKHVGDGIYEREIIWRKSKMIRMLDAKEWRESVEGNYLNHRFNSTVQDAE